MSLMGLTSISACLSYFCGPVPAPRALAGCASLPAVSSRQPGGDAGAQAAHRPLLGSGREVDPWVGSLESRVVEAELREAAEPPSVEFLQPPGSEVPTESLPRIPGPAESLLLVALVGGSDFERQAVTIWRVIHLGLVVASP